MRKEKPETIIENSFRKQVRNNKKISNAYLLVHSDKKGIHLNLAEGKTGDTDAHPQQPNYMASVGKLFTAAIIAILHERGELSFDDTISKHLDNELMNNLHVYREKDYSGEIKISHLLNQSSGLNDVFFTLLNKLKENPEMAITPREAILWGKENLKPVAKPGEKHFYTDTNYYLLGLIVENITKRPFHEALHNYIFNPLEMKNAYMMGYSEPAVKSGHPTAIPIIDDVDINKLKGVHQIDYAGGGVVAPLEEFLLFMKALVGYRLIKPGTLQQMLSDDHRSLPTIRYGYAIWKFVTIPIIMPEKYYCWGCVGVTGAYMFYHPKTESYIIGTFNDMSYRSKALRFMLSKVIRRLI